ncbi:hypothetical protein ACEPPN_010216 [Leptodophora sp. 'Broadleaf-Isolate-01']
MPPSNDIDLQPDLAHLTLSNPAKAKSVDITKLRIDGPNALGASSQADLFMTRKKPVVRRTLEELAASGRSDMDQANDSASATPNTTSFSFTSPVEGKVASSTVGKFPNLTNSALYVGPDYGRRDILAASPNPPPHCKDKEAEDKCLQKKIEWEGERNLMKKQTQDKKNEWDSEQRLLLKEIQDKADEWDVQRRELFKRINAQRKAEANMERINDSDEKTKSQ